MKSTPQATPLKGKSATQMSLPRLVYKSPDIANAKPLSEEAGARLPCSPSDQQSKRQRERRRSISREFSSASVPPEKRKDVILSVILPNAAISADKHKSAKGSLRHAEALTVETVCGDTDITSTVPEAVRRPQKLTSLYIKEKQKSRGVGNAVRRKPAKKQPISLRKKVHPEIEPSILNNTQDEIGTTEQSTESLKLARKVCAIFTAQVIAVTAWLGAVSSSADLQRWYEDRFYLSAIAGAGCVFPLLWFSWFQGRSISQGKTRALLVSFVRCMQSVLLGYACAGVGAAVDWRLLLSTAVQLSCMFSGLTSYSLLVAATQTRNDFYKKGAVLMISLATVVGASLAFAFKVTDVVKTAYCSIVTGAVGIVAVISISHSVHSPPSPNTHSRACASVLGIYAVLDR